MQKLELFAYYVLMIPAFVMNGRNSKSHVVINNVYIFLKGDKKSPFRTRRGGKYIFLNDLNQKLAITF